MLLRYQKLKEIAIVAVLVPAWLVRFWNLGKIVAALKVAKGLCVLLSH